MVDTAKKSQSRAPERDPENAADNLAAVWLEENRAALDTHARFIEEYGTLAERLKASE